jgi:hypothetical protein
VTRQPLVNPAGAPRAGGARDAATSGRVISVRR